MRHNTLPSRRVAIIKKTEPQHNQCVGCNTLIEDGFLRTGTVITGQAFRNMDTTENVVYETAPQTYRVEQEVITKRVPFFTRKKGRLCEECASNYHTFTWRNKWGEEVREQLVKVDAVQGFYKRGAIKNKGRIIRDGDPLSIPAYEK